MAVRTREQDPNSSSGSARGDYSAAASAGAPPTTDAAETARIQLTEDLARIAELPAEQRGEALYNAVRQYAIRTGDQALLESAVQARQAFVNAPKEIFEGLLSSISALTTSAGQRSIAERGNAINNQVGILREMFQNSMSLEMTVDSMQATACGILKMIGTFASAFGFKEFGDELIAAADEYAPDLADGNYDRFFARLDNLDTNISADLSGVNRGATAGGSLASGLVGRISEFEDQYRDNPPEISGTNVSGGDTPAPEGGFRSQPQASGGFAEPAPAPS